MNFDETQNIQIQKIIPLEYQKCQYCSRSFFKGKLKYHQKLCTQENPMIVSPKKSNRQASSKLSSNQKSLIFNKQQKKCEKCNLRLPGFLYQKHIESCVSKNKKQSQTLEKDIQINKKSSTDVNFKQKQDCTLPAIKRITHHGVAKNNIIKQPYQVKLREQLSCFRRAQQIKQIRCPACDRIFSKQASLRHIPICQTLHDNQKLSIALKKHKKVNSLQQQTFLKKSKSKSIEQSYLKKNLSQIQSNPQQSLSKN